MVLDKTSADSFLADNILNLIFRVESDGNIMSSKTEHSK